MTKEVMKQESSVPSIATNMDAWGQTPEMSANDLVIPKVLAMQGLSQFVTDGKAKFGDFCDSVSGEVLGNIDKPIEFIPFHVEKVWILFKETKPGKMDFDGIIPITRENENLPLNDTDEHGVAIRRDRTWNVYTLLADKLKEGKRLPYVMSFRRTSAKAGKKLMTQMYVVNRDAGKIPPAKAMLLKGLKKSNDDGTYVVMDVEESRDSTNEEMTVAFEMLKNIQASDMKVDDSDLKKEPTTKTDYQSESNDY